MGPVRCSTVAFLLLLACSPHLVQGARVGIDAHSFTNATKSKALSTVEPFTMIGFSLGSVAAVGSIYGMTKSYQAIRESRKSAVWAEETLRVYRAHMAQGCPMLANFSRALTMRHEAMMVVQDQVEEVGSACAIIRETPTFQTFVDKTMQEECALIREGGASLEAVAEKCEEKRMQSGIDAACSVQNASLVKDAMQHVALANARLQGLREGLCPNVVPDEWKPPEPTVENVESLLAYYPKCKRPVGRSHSRYCWSSCAQASRIAQSCDAETKKQSNFVLNSTGIVAEKPKGVSIGRHLMTCNFFGFPTSRQRALCSVAGKKDTAPKPVDSFNSLVESRILDATIIGVIGLVYSTMGVSGWALSVAEGSVKAMKSVGNIALINHVEDHHEHEQQVLCSSATTFWLDVLTSSAVSAASLNQHFVEAGLNLHNASTEVVTEADWSKMSGQASAQALKPGSVWTCKASSGCMVPSDVNETKATDSKVLADSGITASCTTRLGDFRICPDSEFPRDFVELPKPDLGRVVAAIAPSSCFHNFILNGLPMSSFLEAHDEGMSLTMDREECVEPLEEARKMSLALAQAREQLMDICSK